MTDQTNAQRATTDGIMLGGVELLRITEWSGPSGVIPQMFPDSTREAWEEQREVMVPDHWDPVADRYMTTIQIWILRSEGKTILVDTGNGNDKERPQHPDFHHLQTPFLQELAALGIRPEDVDIVINTHLHLDHVGWNTRLVDGQWVPTFPNATYLVAEPDFVFWNPKNSFHRKGGVVNQNMFDDSVLPVHQAGQMVLWNNSYEVDGNLRLELAAGHTPGQSMLKLDSGGDRAVFIGDMMHSPMQIGHWHWNTCFCEDPKEAAKSRRQMLEWSSDNNALIVPTHFPNRPIIEVERSYGSFNIKNWIEFPG